MFDESSAPVLLALGACESKLVRSRKVRVRCISLAYTSKTGPAEEDRDAAEACGFVELLAENSRAAGAEAGAGIESGAPPVACALGWAVGLAVSVACCCTCADGGVFSLKTVGLASGAAAFGGGGSLGSSDWTIEDPDGGGGGSGGPAATRSCCA